MAVRHKVAPRPTKNAEKLLKLAPRGKQNPRWPTCLWCDAELPRKCFHDACLCMDCGPLFAREQRRELGRIVQRWWKWKGRGSYRPIGVHFVGKPGPWQHAILNLAKRIGFVMSDRDEPEPDPHPQHLAACRSLPESDRAGVLASVHERLGMTPKAVREALAGTRILPRKARERLINDGQRWARELGQGG